MGRVVAFCRGFRRMFQGRQEFSILSVQGCYQRISPVFERHLPRRIAVFLHILQNDFHFMLMRHQAPKLELRGKGLIAGGKAKDEPQNRAYGWNLP